MQNFSTTSDQKKQSVFDSVCRFFAENGYDKVFYPSSWDKTAERKKIIELEDQQEREKASSHVMK